MSVNITLFYSILHMLVDGVCAFAMYGIFLPRGEGMLFFILYNFCAFALQMPFGVILDMLQIRLVQRAHFYIEPQGQKDIVPEDKKRYAIEIKKQNLCLQTVAVGILFTILGSMMHPVVLGIGNALFHIGGGVGTIHEDTARNWNGKGLGVFVAPGALGLYLGTLAGKNGIQQYLLWIMCTLMAGIFGILLYLWNSRTNAKTNKQTKLYQETVYLQKISEEKITRKSALDASAVQQIFSKGTLSKGLQSKETLSKETLSKERFSKEILSMENLCFVVCCVLVVILRSYIGMAVTFPWKTTIFSGLLAVLAIVFGKMAGGIFGAKYGFRKISIISLLFAAICYICSAWMPMGIAALLLFNMTMPITLYLLISKLPQLSGFCFGLLTFALFLGFLPEYFGLRPIGTGNLIGSIGSIFSLVLLLFCFAENKNKK